MKQRSLSVQLFADDIQINTSILPLHGHSATSDVKNWMIENKLQLYFTLLCFICFFYTDASLRILDECVSKWCIFNTLWNYGLNK